MQQVFTCLTTILFLGLCSIEDIREKQISLGLTVVFGITGLIANLFLGKDILEVVKGTAPGLFILLIALLSNQQIGYGDGVILVSTGLLVGARQNWIMLIAALVFCGLYSLAVNVDNIGEKSITLPFAPFLTAGYFVSVLEGMGR